MPGSQEPKSTLDPLARSVWELPEVAKAHNRLRMLKADLRAAKVASYGAEPDPSAGKEKGGQFVTAEERRRAAAAKAQALQERIRQVEAELNQAVAAASVEARKAIESRLRERATAIHAALEQLADAVAAWENLLEQYAARGWTPLSEECRPQLGGQPLGTVQVRTMLQNLQNNPLVK